MAYRLLAETKLMQCKIATIQQIKTTQQKGVSTLIKDIYKNVNSRIIHISQRGETTPMSINSRTDKL